MTSPSAVHASRDTARPFAAACLGMLVFGVVLTTLGAVLPSVTPRFGLAKETAATLFPLLSFGILAGSIVFGPIVDRRGYRTILIASIALTIAGLEGIAFAPSFGALRVAVVAIGFGGGIINGATNALVADISVGGRGAGLSLLGIFFGFGAVGVPLALGALLGTYPYDAILASIGGAMLAPLTLIVVTRFPPPKQPQGFPIAAGVRLLKQPFILLCGLMLFLESGMEITVGGWTATFFAEELGITPRWTLVLLSIFWLGMILARLALGTVLRTAPPLRAMAVCIAVALCGSALLLGAHHFPVAAAGVFLLGVGFAANFPVVLGLVADRYAALSGTAFSIVIALALVGGMTLPYIAGVLGSAYNLRTSFLLVPAALLCLAVLLAVAGRRRAPALAPTAG